MTYSIHTRSIDREAYIRTLTDDKSASALQELAGALNESSPVVRMAAAEVLSRHKTEFSIRLLESALTDPNYLVRITAAESLGEIGDESAVRSLLASLSDKSYLFRGWVVNTLGDLVREPANVVSILETMLATEKSSFVRLNIYCTLYKFGDDNALRYLLAYLRSRSYRTRCAASNSLSEIASPNNCAIIVRIIQDALNKETTVAAKSSMQNALAVCEELLTISLT